MSENCDPLAGWAGLNHKWAHCRGGEDACITIELLSVTDKYAYVGVDRSWADKEGRGIDKDSYIEYTENDTVWHVYCDGVNKSQNLASIRICYEEADEPEPEPDPYCRDFTDQSNCERAGCYWYGGACHGSPEGDEPPEGTTALRMDRTVYIAGIGFEMSALNCKLGTAVVEAVGTGIRRVLTIGGAAAVFRIYGVGANIIYMAAVWTDSECIKMAVRHANVPPEVPGSEGATDGKGNMMPESDPDNPLNPDNPDNPDNEGSVNHPDNPDNNPTSPDNDPNKGVQPEGVLVRRKRDDWSDWFGEPFPYGEGEDEHNYTDLMRRDLQIYNCIIHDKCTDLEGAVKDPDLVAKLKAWYKDLLAGVAAGELTKEEFNIALNRGIVDFSHESFIAEAFELVAPSIAMAGLVKVSGTTPKKNMRIQIVAKKKHFGYDWLAADNVLKEITSDEFSKFETELELEDFGAIIVYARAPQEWYEFWKDDHDSNKVGIWILTWEILVFLIIASALVYDKSSGGKLRKMLKKR